MKRTALALGAITVFAISACSGKPKDDAAGGQGNRPAAGAPVSADPAARGGGGGQAGAGGGRRGMTVTLAASDVATAVRRPIERGISITGDLRPIERIDVRARIEGDLTDVYVREGQSVGAGALLARFQSVEQEAARQSAAADRAAAQSALSTAQWNYDQSKDLFKEGAIPERDLRTAEQQLSSARAQVAAAESRLRSANVALADTRVLAPLAGVIETRTAAPGEHLARGGPLFTLVRNDMLELAASVPAAQANDLKIGQTIRFSAGNQAVIGRIARISPTVDPTSRAVTVYVQVPNKNGALRGGTFATGRLVLSIDNSALAIPSPAVRFGADGQPYVYKIAGGQLENTPIHVGYTDDVAGIVEVTDGIKEGDKVVVGNVGTLGRGMKVQVLGADAGRQGK